ncbi:MAG: hypothetical protein IPO08_23365 [Xanthomonadales bacterium]|nr:hypothetical protein [Xanthomonadales bacterium]
MDLITFVLTLSAIVMLGWIIAGAWFFMKLRRYTDGRFPKIGMEPACYCEARKH